MPLVLLASLTLEPGCALRLAPLSRGQLPWNREAEIGIAKIHWAPIKGLWFQLHDICVGVLRGDTRGALHQGRGSGPGWGPGGADGKSLLSIPTQLVPARQAAMVESSVGAIILGTA